MSSSSSLRLSVPKSDDVFRGKVGELADKVSHESRPTLLLFASCRNRSYTDRIRGEAGRVFGRANGALMSAFKEGESLDISNCLRIPLATQIRYATEGADIFKSSKFS